MTPEARFQVIHDFYGLVESFNKKQDAFKLAAYKALTTKEPYKVLDLMAKKNKTESWTFHSDGKHTETIKQ